MAETQLTFKRYEKKYLLSPEQYRALRASLEGRIRPDQFAHSTVCSIYFDDERFSLIRHSLDGPVYKEKLRLRSYNVPDENGEVFIELKKKFKGIVYKRRVAMTNRQAVAYLAGLAPAPEPGQITHEIDFFLRSHQLRPRAFIACDRSAYVAVDNDELRVTFDENLRWREDRLDLCAGSDGQLMLRPGEVLMELKIPNAAPMWLARLLSELRIFPTSFSKYGTCFRDQLLQEYFFDTEPQETESGVISFV